MTYDVLSGMLSLYTTTTTIFHKSSRRSLAKFTILVHSLVLVVGVADSVSPADVSAHYNMVIYLLSCIWRQRWTSCVLRSKGQGQIRPKSTFGPLCHLITLIDNSLNWVGCNIGGSAILGKMSSKASLSPWLSGLMCFLSHNTCWAWLAGDYSFISHVTTA